VTIFNAMTVPAFESKSNSLEAPMIMMSRRLAFHRKYHEISFLFTSTFSQCWKSILTNPEGDIYIGGTHAITFTVHRLRDTDRWSTVGYSIHRLYQLKGNLHIVVSQFKQVVLNLFTYLTPFYQTRLPDLPPVHSVVLISLKYEIS